MNVYLLQATKMPADLFEGEDDSDDLEDALNVTGLESPSGGDDDGDDDEDDIEFISMQDKVYYLAPILRIFALLHTFTAFAMIIGYYCLKVSNL